jgi:hypothetical protein
MVAAGLMLSAFLITRPGDGKTDIMGQVCLGPAFRACNGRAVGQMLDLHEQPHMRKPANVTFMHLSATAVSFSDIVVTLIGHVFHP